MMDWLALLQTGLARLGLRPDQFWALTPAELATMLGRDLTKSPLTRARLGELARAFPDDMKGQGDGD